MSSLEFNKMAMAVLIAAIVMMIGYFFGEAMVRPTMLAENAYFIDTGEEAVEEVEVVEVVAPIAERLLVADASGGEGLARACVACHSFDNGGANKIGPNLWDIVDRPMAAVEGFSYSSSLSERGGVWSYEELEGFLLAPREWVPGTTMSYSGMRKPEDRADLIAWLRSLSDSPAALPQ